MTTVYGAVVRPWGLGTFADITDAAFTVARAKTSITFDAELTEAQVAAIWSRMTSRDDADETARATLRGADGATNLAEMVRAYVLGDPMPDPVFP